MMPRDRYRGVNRILEDFGMSANKGKALSLATLEWVKQHRGRQPEGGRKDFDVLPRALATEFVQINGARFFSKIDSLCMSPGQFEFYVQGVSEMMYRQSIYQQDVETRPRRKRHRDDFDEDSVRSISPKRVLRGESTDSYRLVSEDAELDHSGMHMNQGPRLRIEDSPDTPLIVLANKRLDRKESDFLFSSASTSLGSCNGDSARIGADLVPKTGVESIRPSFGPIESCPQELPIHNRDLKPHVNVNQAFTTSIANTHPQILETGSLPNTRDNKDNESEHTEATIEDEVIEVKSKRTEAATTDPTCEIRFGSSRCEVVGSQAAKILESTIVRLHSLENGLFMAAEDGTSFDCSAKVTELLCFIERRLNQK